MYKNLSRFVTNLWEKSAAKMRLTFFEYIIFLTLCVFEKLYILVFFVSQLLRKKKGGKVITGLNILSVGNIAVGGTGKSVFTGLLVRILGSECTAIISRGYGGKVAREKSDDDCVLVSDGTTIFCSPDVCGDEPFMLAQTLNVPVIVGRDRYKSCLFINNYLNLSFGRAKVKYIVLDDGYQNHILKKDCEILLLDARSPLGNGHCLPAGCLREKDYSRADLIVLTHADEVKAEKIIKIKSKYLQNFDQHKIFCGVHKFAGIFLFDKQKIEGHDYKNKKFLVVAAIGSFTGFVQSVEKLGVQVVQVLQFPDHYSYSNADILLFSDTIEKNNLDGIITTQKDWSKLSFLINSESCELQVFVSRVNFEFMSKEEELSFEKKLKSCV